MLSVNGRSTSATETRPLSTPRLRSAIPVPVPAPVATKTSPTVLEEAPMAVKFVEPTSEIEYGKPTTKVPAPDSFLTSL